MNKQFLEANQLHSLRKLHSTYEFIFELPNGHEDIKCFVWELFNGNADYKYEAELSHTIQNEKQSGPYTPCKMGSTPDEAFEATIAAFMMMDDEKSTKVELIC